MRRRRPVANRFANPRRQMPRAFMTQALAFLADPTHMAHSRCHASRITKQPPKYGTRAATYFLLVIACSCARCSQRALWASSPPPPCIHRPSYRPQGSSFHPALCSRQCPQQRGQTLDGLSSSLGRPVWARAPFSNVSLRNFQINLASVFPVRTIQSPLLSSSPRPSDLPFSSTPSTLFLGSTHQFARHNRHNPITTERRTTRSSILLRLPRRIHFPHPPKRLHRTRTILRKPLRHILHDRTNRIRLWKTLPPRHRSTGTSLSSPAFIVGMSLVSTHPSFLLPTLPPPLLLLRKSRVYAKSRTQI